MDRLPEPELMDLAEEAAAYARADFAAVNAAFVARLLEVSGEAASVQLLDVGTGPGDIPLRIAVAKPGWKVTAVDAAAAMLQHARRVDQGSSVCWVQADAKHLPFAAQSFDVVFSNSILHHVADASALWQAVRQVARPGGLLFFRDLIRPANEAEAWRLVRQHAGEESPLLQEEFYRSFLSAYTVEEVRAQLRAAGLEALGVMQVTDRHLDIVGRVP